MDLRRGDESEQYKRTQRRLKFLSLVEWLENKQVVMETYKGADVNGVFRSADYEFANIHVHSLNTPIGLVPEAIIRTSDIVSIKCPLLNGISKTRDCF